jgi:peroxiredoxin
MRGMERFGNLVTRTDMYCVVLSTLFFILMSFNTVLASEVTRLKIGTIPPRGVLKDLKGNSVMIPYQNRGEAVILHFWAVGCSSCRREMAYLETLHKSFSGRGLSILAVNVGQKRPDVEKMVKSIGITYKVLLDADGKVADEYEVAGLPRTFLIDRKGAIRYKIAGEAGEEFLKKRVLSIM